jgi:hypothetical protein
MVDIGRQTEREREEGLDVLRLCEKAAYYAEEDRQGVLREMKIGDKQEEKGSNDN